MSGTLPTQPSNASRLTSTTRGFAAFAAVHHWAASPTSSTPIQSPAAFHDTDRRTACTTISARKTPAVGMVRAVTSSSTAIAMVEGHRIDSDLIGNASARVERYSSSMYELPSALTASSPTTGRDYREQADDDAADPAEAEASHDREREPGHDGGDQCREQVGGDGPLLDRQGCDHAGDERAAGRAGSRRTDR